MWSTPRTLGHGTNSPVPMVDTGVPRKLARVARGLLVDPSGRWTRAGVARDSWSTPRALGYGPESPGASGRPRGTSGMGANLPGQLVDRGRQTRTRVARKSWSTPRAQRHGPVSPRTAGQPRVPWDPSPIHPGQLVDPAGLRTQTRVSWDSWSTPGHSEAGRSRPGQPVDPAGPRTQVRVARVSRLTPRALGLWPESPRTAGRPHGPSETSQRHPGLLVHGGGPQT